MYRSEEQIESNSASAVSSGGRYFPYCSKATILKKDKYTTTYRLYYTKQNLTSAKNSAIGLVGVFRPGSKAFKAVISLSGANANPTSGIIMDVRYPNSFKGGGIVLKTQKWNK